MNTKYLKPLSFAFLLATCSFQSHSIEITNQSFELKCNSWRPVVSKKEDSKEQLTVFVWNHSNHQLKIYSSVIKEDENQLIGKSDYNDFSFQSLDDNDSQVVHMTFKTENTSVLNTGRLHTYTEIRTFSFQFSENTRSYNGVRASFMFGHNGVVQIGDDKILSDCVLKKLNK